MDIEIEEVVVGDVKSNINDDESIVDDDDLDDLELYCVEVVAAFPALNIFPALLLNKKNGWVGGGGTLMLLLDDVNTSSTSTRVAVIL